VEERGGLSLDQFNLWQALGDGWYPQFWVSPLGAMPGMVFFMIDVADPVAMVAVEVDGPSHCGKRRQRDLDRQRWLEFTGWTVFRFTNKEVRSSLTSVVVKIRSHSTT
jgi:very-short-patch-repair endonuclease